jgi:hypothetical protein
MATYLYLCEEKHGEFEEEHSIKIKLEFCPHCKKEDEKDVPIKRLIAAASPGKVELTGQELNAAIREGSRKIQERARRDEAFQANIVGEKKWNGMVK